MLVPLARVLDWIDGSEGRWGSFFQTRGLGLSLGGGLFLRVRRDEAENLEISEIGH